jgi:pyruvate carboxylase
VKVTTWGRDARGGGQRADRALREFRIRGVKTNIAFLLNLIDHPTFKSGERRRPSSTTRRSCSDSARRATAPRKSSRISAT